MHTTWSQLSDEERSAILAAAANGEAVSSVAARYNLKTSSLSRELRRQRQKQKQEQYQDQDGCTISREESRNAITLESRSDRITSLEDLLRACNVDLSVWRVDRYVINKWEVGAKEEHTNLEIESGVATGTVRKEGLQIHPLFQVKAWLVRINPEPVFPVIQPVTTNITHNVPKPPTGGLCRALIWADPHFGFSRDLRDGHLSPLHDRRALDIVTQIAHEVQPDRIDCLGDFLDLPEWTDRFLRAPEFYHTTQPALLEAHWWLAQLRLYSPKSAITIYEGNHDRRMRDAIVTHLRAAYDLRPVDEMDMPPALSVPRLLGLHQLGVTWVGGYPDNEGWLNSSVRLSHGDKAQVPGNTAKAVVNEADTTEIFGHIHRVEWVSRTKYERDRTRTIAGFCPGCTCHTDGRVPAKSGRLQWQTGCAIVDYQADGDLYTIHPLIIDNGRAVWNGKLFTARDRLNEIKAAWKGWNW